MLSHRVEEQSCSLGQVFSRRDVLQRREALCCQSARQRLIVANLLLRLQAKRVAPNLGRPLLLASPHVQSHALRRLRRVRAYSVRHSWPQKHALQILLLRYKQQSVEKTARLGRPAEQLRRGMRRRFWADALPEAGKKIVYCKICSGCCIVAGKQHLRLPYRHQTRTVPIAVANAKKQPFGVTVPRDAKLHHSAPQTVRALRRRLRCRGRESPTHRRLPQPQTIILQIGQILRLSHRTSEGHSQRTQRHQRWLLTMHGDGVRRIGVMIDF